MQMQNAATIVMILVGAAALWIEAHRQFANRATIEQNDSYPILRGVDLESLSARSVYLRGYLFYVGCYLIIYGMSLGIWEVGDVVVNGTKSRLESGGQGGLPIGSTGGLDADGYARPLAIAVALISLMSVGALAKFERGLRSFAHRLAGIPHSIFRVITRLNRVNYDKIGGRTAYLPRTQKFTGACESAQRKSSNVQAIAEDLKVIDLLAPSVIGIHRDRIWPQENVIALEELINRQRSELDRLQEKISAPVDDAEKLESIRLDASASKRDLQALFAVLFTKNLGATVNAEVHKPTKAILDALRERRRDYLMDSMIGALLLNFFVLVPIVAYIAETTVQMGPETGFFAAFERNRSFIIESIIIFDIKSSVILFVAASLALVIRRGKIETDRWEPWSLKHIPYRRLLQASFWPSILVVICSLAVLLFVDTVFVYIESGDLIPSETFAASFEAHSPYAIATLLYGVIVCLAVFFISDLHDQFRADRTALIAASFAVPYLIWAYFSNNITNELSAAFVAKDALLYFVHALLFLLVFAVLVERGED